MAYQPGCEDRICTRATGTNGLSSDITVFSVPVPGPQPTAGDRGEEEPAFVEPYCSGKKGWQDWSALRFRASPESSSMSLDTSDCA